MSQLRRRQPLRACRFPNCAQISDCSICLLTISPPATAILVPCDHDTFHEECILHWLQMNGEDPRCPLCRRRVLEFQRLDGSVHVIIDPEKRCQECDEIHKKCSLCRKRHHDPEEHVWPEGDDDDGDWIPSTFVRSSTRRCATRSQVNRDGSRFEELTFQAPLRRATPASNERRCQRKIRKRRTVTMPPPPETSEEEVNGEGTGDEDHSRDPDWGTSRRVLRRRVVHRR
jgi:hypothetical protein